MSGRFVLEKIKTDFGPSTNAPMLHMLSLCFLCVFVAQSQKSDLIATVLAGKLIPERPVFWFACFLLLEFATRLTLRVKRQEKQPRLSLIFRPLRSRRPAAVCGGAEAAEELHQAAEETEQRAERAAQEAPEKGERERERLSASNGKETVEGVCFQVWNLSKEQTSRKSQIQSDSQRRRSQIEKNLKRSIKKK